MLAFDRRQQLSFGADTPDALSAVTEQSAQIEWSLESYKKTASLRVLRNMLTVQESKAIIAAVPEEVNVDEDSVDALPTYEWPIESEYDNRKDTELKTLTDPIIATRILPYIRQKYQCSSCQLCTSMLRRYLPTERRGGSNTICTCALHASSLISPDFQVTRSTSTRKHL